MQQVFLEVHCYHTLGFFNMIQSQHKIKKNYHIISLNKRFIFIFCLITLTMYLDPYWIFKGCDMILVSVTKRL